MNILIVDDTAENLEAAKQAAANFTEHKFRFMNSAKEAAAAISEVDAIITDLFFPDEGHEDDGVLAALYLDYRCGVSYGQAFDQVEKEYYGGNQRQANWKLNDVLGLLEDGTMQKAIENLVEFFEGRGYLRDQESAKKHRARLQSLPTPQFPYGGALMLCAKELGKRHCLVSDIHRHAGSYEDVSDAIDGMILLLPLIEKGVVSVKQATADGKGSLTYLGSDEIRQAGKRKSDPAVWAEAIRRTLKQK